MQNNFKKLKSYIIFLQIMLKRGKKPLETESLECIPNKQPINKVTYLNGQNSRKKKTALFYISSHHPCKELEGPKTWVAIKCKRQIRKIEELLFEPHLLGHPPSKHFNIYNFIRNVIKRKNKFSYAYCIHCKPFYLLKVLNLKILLSYFRKLKTAKLL